MSNGLWFDVEKKNYTTMGEPDGILPELWFDVEKKNYTTFAEKGANIEELWFDVEKKNYTTWALPSHLQAVVV